MLFSKTDALPVRDFLFLPWPFPADITNKTKLTFQVHSAKGEEREWDVRELWTHTPIGPHVISPEDVEMGFTLSGLPEGPGAD